MNANHPNSTASVPGTLRSDWPQDDVTEQGILRPFYDGEHYPKGFASLCWSQVKIASHKGCYAGKGFNLKR